MPAHGSTSYPRTAEVTPIVVEAYELSRREKDVAQLLVTKLFAEHHAPLHMADENVVVVEREAV